VNDRGGGKVVRRRRSWYRRRLRIQRTAISIVMLTLVAGICWQTVARRLALPTLHPAQILPDSFWARGDVRSKLSLAAAQAGTARVSSPATTYPYSVIPGGIRSAAELREVAARDYVVRRHFAGFNYERARLVRAREERLVYLSYRFHNQVFWTRKKVHLRKGELLITDGNTTARTRCGNQVAENPKPEVSEEEPQEDVFDQPVAELEPTRASLPFHSTLTKPILPGATADPPEGPRLFGGGFFFPLVPFGAPIPTGLCETAAQEQWEQSHGDNDNDEGKEKRCRPHHRRPVAPEPATVLLILSGLAGVYWRYRKSQP